MSDNRLHILSSGSKGNAVIVESGDELLLIDQGLSFKCFSGRCAVAGIDPARIAGIVITHEHIDHVSGVPLTAHRLHLTVYAAPAVIEYLAECGGRYEFDTHELSPRRPAKIGRFTVEPFPVMHDARDPYGFTVTLPNGERLTLVTDTGIVTQQIFAQIAASDYLIIEANHDPAMLYRNPRYPPDLKQRIRGASGHLSNEQCLEALERLPHARLKKVVFAHLSEENNSPELVCRSAAECFGRTRFTGESFIAPQQGPLTIPLD